MKKKYTLIIFLGFLSTLVEAQAFEWAKGIGGDGISNVIMKDLVATDNQGVFIVGSFSGTIDFDPSDVVNNKVALSNDGFAARYDANGNLIWVFTTNAIGNEEISVATFCNALGQNMLNVVVKTAGNAFTLKALNSVDGTIYASSPEYVNQGVVLEINGINKTFSNEETAFYIVGSFAGTLQFGETSITNSAYSDAFCLKFSVTNTDWFAFNWAKRFGIQSNNEANDVAIHGQNTNPVIVGGFYGTIDFGSGSTYASAGAKDVFVATLNSTDGSIAAPNAVFTFGSTTDDIANAIYRSSENLSPILIGGKFSSTADFDAGDSVTSLTSIGGGYDGFLASYSTSSANDYALNWAVKVGEAYQDEIVDVVYNTNVYYAARIQNSTFGASIYLGSLDSNGGNRVYGGQLVPSMLNSQNYVTGLEMNVSNELYCAGIYGVNTDFDPGVGVATLFPVGNAFDGYIQKMNSSSLSFNNPIQSDFVINPNPATTEIMISNTIQTGISAVTITDINGRIVKQSTFDNLPDITINITDLSDGVYIMKIVSTQGTTIQKLIKD